MKSKLIKSLIACVIIGVVSIGGYYGYKHFFATKTTASTNQYITSTAKKMNLQVNIEGTGSVYAGVTKDIVSNNSGTLSGLGAKIGDVVSVGDSLFTVNSDDLKQSVTKAQNNLEKQKLTLASSKNANEIAINTLSVKDAETQLSNAVNQLNKMTVTSPVNGIVTSQNSSNGDSVQSGKAIITVVDPTSMKVKVSVDELNISKVKVGQKSEIKFDALKDKTYEGTVESVAQIGTTSNNSTTYDVVVSISNPTDIKIGMNANVNILVESKDNAITVPKEALVEKNEKKYVMVASSSSANSSTENAATSTNSQKQNTNNISRNMSAGTSSNGRLVEVTVGIENDNYVEILEGVEEGTTILISLPSTSTSTTTNNKNSLSGFGTNFGGTSGGTRPQGGSKN